MHHFGIALHQLLIPIYVGRSIKTGDEHCRFGSGVLHNGLKVEVLDHELREIVECHLIQQAVDLRLALRDGNHYDMSILRKLLFRYRCCERVGLRLSFFLQR